MTTKLCEAMKDAVPTLGLDDVNELMTACQRRREELQKAVEPREAFARKADNMWLPEEERARQRRDEDLNGLEPRARLAAATARAWRTEADAA